MSKKFERIGDVPHGTTDSGNPAKVGGIARTTNPTRVDNADRVAAFFDVVGRQVLTPYQVRDLVSTGYATLTRSQEGTVIAGVAGVFLDLVQVTAASTSSVAIPVLLRAVSGGNVIDRVVVPVGATVVKTYSVPHPQDETGNAITAQVDVTDQSDSPVTVTALAVRNV